MVIPGLKDSHSSLEVTGEMANRIARAVNLLEADRDFLNSGVDVLIDIIEDHFGDDGAGNDS